MKKSDPLGWLITSILYALGGRLIAHWGTGQMVVYGACGFVGCAIWDTIRLLNHRRKYRRVTTR